jgi:hypothetical protein
MRATHYTHSILLYLITLVIFPKGANHKAPTERRGQVVSTPTSYFGGPGFVSRLWISWLRFFVVSLLSNQAKAGIVP